jgi:hypothetical protein
MHSTSTVSRALITDDTIRTTDVVEVGTETIGSRSILSENFCLTVKLKPLERKILHHVISIASAVEWQNHIYEVGSKLREKVAWASDIK